MKIYETAVRKPVSTALLFLGAIVLGVFSLNNLSIDLYPEIEIPYLTVLTTYQGASAEDIEQNVSRVLENSLNTVSNLKKLTSRSQENMSVIMLQFEWGANLDEASNDVRDVLGRIETYLPAGIDKPFIVKFSSNMMPIMYLSATAKESYHALYKLLEEKVANPLNRISGVGAVSISGAPVREVQVNVDPLKMEAYRLSIEQIGQMIAQENSNIPAGFLDIGSERMSLRIQGEFTESEMVKNIVVANMGGKVIRIADIAVVKDTLRKRSVNQTINGEKGVSIIIQKQSGANSVTTIQEIHKMLPELTKTLPPDVKIGVIFDTAEYITNSINSLTETLMYAFIFVVLVVLFFLGRWRATVIIVITIPVSLITSFIYLFFTGGTINIVSLSSFSIGIGLVVDDAIVILENIVKHIERGARPKDAAVYATNEVWLAVIATTFTLLAVFLPLTLVGGIAGIMFKQLGWIVSIVTTVSTVAAISLTPMMASKMLKYKYVHTYRGLGVIFKPVDRFLNNLDMAYARLVTWAVHHKSVTIIAAILIFGVSLLLLGRVPTEFMPTTDNGQISANIELPVNANLAETVTIANYLEEKFVTLCPEIERVSITSGADDRAGFSALFGNSGTNVISFMVVLNKLKERDRSMFDIADIMRQEIAKIPTVVKYTVSPGGSGGMGMMGSSNVDVKVFGHDFNETTRIAKELAEKMKQIPGTRDITVSREEMKVELRVDFDREKLAHFGMTTAAAGAFVRNRINGLTASLYREGGEEYNIVVRYGESFRTSIQDIENIVLYNSMGRSIRVGDVGTVIERFTPPRIEREDRQRVVTVSAALSGAALGDVAKATKAAISTLELPVGVDVALSGAVEDQQESFKDLFTLLALIILLVYIVLATQFESFRMPFIVMMTVPFSFTGVFLALWITNTPLGLIALIGAVMLVGIVVKNGVVIVDFTNLQRERKVPLYEAVITAGKSRLRPVLMTSVSTILCMLPLAMSTGEGAEIWRPMGIAIVGGLTFSTMLTLLVVPAIYAAFDEHRERRLQKRNTQIP